MNRELKFRVWDTSSNEWVKDRDGDEDRLWYMISFDGKLVYSDNQGCCVMSQEYVVQQYTGLKDKNGKMIFEGDIINFGKNIDNLDFEENAVIAWGKNYCGICVRWSKNKNGYSELLTNMDSKDMFVLGNIFENPGLLK
jgi:uncharacterized phage protein (TIGR01671 family)